MFGPERICLINDDIALADAALTVPLNPAFASLNLAQAVLLVGHAWFPAGDATPPTQLEPNGGKPASKAELVNFFGRLEAEPRLGEDREGEGCGVMCRYWWSRCLIKYKILH